jgi:hypothetical protein
VFAQVLESSMIEEMAALIYFGQSHILFCCL